MEHKTCVHAIDSYNTEKGSSNVSDTKNEVMCDDKQISKCNWIGNGEYYACINKPRKNVERVHYGNSSGKT